MNDYDASGHEAIHSLIEEFADVARQVHASEDFDESLMRISTTAVHAIGGCEAASISLLRVGAGPFTKGSTSSLATSGDNVQYEENEGPCLDATMLERWIYTRDLRNEPRWPRSAGRLATELGVGSMFSARLSLDAAPHETLGGMNLYATKPDAFSTQDQMLAILLSSLGAVVVDAARQQQQLRAAIESRQVIGEAIGILRSQSNLSSQQAFEMLSRASQRMNVKLRDLARQIAEGSRDGAAVADAPIVEELREKSEDAGS